MVAAREEWLVQKHQNLVTRHDYPKCRRLVKISRHPKQDLSEAPKHVGWSNIPHCRRRKLERRVFRLAKTLKVLGMPKHCRSSRRDIMTIMRIRHATTPRSPDARTPCLSLASAVLHSPLSMALSTSQFAGGCAVASGRGAGLYFRTCLLGKMEWSSCSTSAYMLRVF